MKIRSFFTVLIILTTFTWLTGCTGGRNNGNEDDMVDTIRKDTLNIDSLEQLYGNNVMPLAADELFDDFFFNFAASGKLQRERICFPLKTYHNDKEQYLTEKQWTTNHFYLKQGYCTGIFSREQDEDIVNDTTVRQAAVQHIDLKTKKVENYHFVKLNGAWMLNSITNTDISNINNAEFIDFYAQFATDEAYQKKALHKPVETTVPDPDSDFGTITGTFYPEQWNNFKPSVMPTTDMYNVIYGTDGLKHKKSIVPNYNMLFIIRGIANGLTTTMKFTKKANQWQLISIAN